MRRSFQTAWTAWTTLYGRLASSRHAADDAFRLTVELPWSNLSERAEQTGGTTRTVRTARSASSVDGPVQSARASQPPTIGSVKASPAGSHRERVLAMDLEHLKICSAARCRRLRAGGVTTAGDLLICDPSQVADQFRSPERAERAIRRLRAAVRMAAAVDRMTPRDAVLLIAVHRRSIRTLAMERPAVLHRDLERFSLSSRGSRLVGRRGIPSVRRLKRWIETSGQLTGYRPTTNPQLA